MFYDVHLLAADDWDDPRGALARLAARDLRTRAVDPATGLPPRRSRRPRGLRPPGLSPAASPEPPPGATPEPSLAATPDRPAPVAPPPVTAEVVERVRARWVRAGEGMRVDVGADTLLVRLPYWYAGKQARVQAKVLHGLVTDLEKASGRRGFDPQLDDWFSRRDARDTAAVLDAVADFEAREHVDSPAVDARRAARAEANRGRRLRRGRGPT